MSYPQKPLLIGALMAPMMLWMLHSVLTDNAGMTVWAALLFLAAHVAVGLVALLAAILATRLSPRWRDRLSRLHKPSLPHVAQMFAGMAIASFMTHLWLHGGLI